MSNLQIIDRMRIQQLEDELELARQGIRTLGEVELMEKHRRELTRRDEIIEAGRVSAAQRLIRTNELITKLNEMSIKAAAAERRAYLLELEVGRLKTLLAREQLENMRVS